SGQHPRLRIRQSRIQTGPVSRSEISLGYWLKFLIAQVATRRCCSTRSRAGFKVFISLPHVPAFHGRKPHSCQLRAPFSHRADRRSESTSPPPLSTRFGGSPPAQPRYPH